MTQGLADSEGNRRLPNPAVDHVPNPPFSPTLTALERTHLDTFDVMDFEVFTHADWRRLDESHAPNVRVHWPDGHYTDGLEQHVDDLAALFAWAPDCNIVHHPLRLAKDDLTCVVGVMAGTFTRPMPDGAGSTIEPTGRKFALNMATVGVWNSQGVMDEEFLFWDNQTLYAQIGLTR